MAVALAPGRGQGGLEPRRGGHGETVQRVAHGLADACQAIAWPDRGEEMGRIGAGRASRFAKVVGLALPSQRLEAERLGPPRDETHAACAEDRRSTPRLRAF